MNVNFEAIEKAWFKPKHTVLDELEEFIIENYFYDDVGMKIIDPSLLLDKIQELKKGNENDK